MNHEFDEKNNIIFQLIAYHTKISVLLKIPSSPIDSITSVGVPVDEFCFPKSLSATTLS